jgi:hypothetical protein
MPERPELLRWFQFEGNLNDTIDEIDENLSFIPVADKTPLWTSVGQSYGLSTGSEDAYRLSPVNFFRSAQDEGGGIFLIGGRHYFQCFFPVSEFNN